MADVWDKFQQGQQAGMAPALAQSRLAIDSLGMLTHMREMEGEERVKGILSKSTSLNDAIPKLMQAGPVGMKAAGVLSKLYSDQATQAAQVAAGNWHNAQAQDLSSRQGERGRQEAAGGALARLISGGGYQANNPDAMAPTGVLAPRNPDDAESPELLAKLREADKAGPFAMDAPNARNVQALSVLAQPKSAVSALLKPPAAAKGYNLAPGATRYDENNQPVVTAPGKPDADGKPPMGYRKTMSGDLEPIPGGPADVKAREAADKKESGINDVDVALATLRDAYGRLEKGGGITSTQNSAVGNILPSISSTGAGQAAGKLFGTENQSARNDIAMARPSLLAALMKATGMSAKQMDSNAELKLWLSTATDPTLDVESNRRALNNIERKYITKSAPTAATSDKTVARSGTVKSGPNKGKRIVEYTDGTQEVQ